MTNPHTFLTSPWWAMGSQLRPDDESRYINETATRARAGILNAVSATTIFILLREPQIDIIPYVGPLVIWDMLTAGFSGLTPLSPFGILGTIITMRSVPVWTPFAPKRFAWFLGAAMGVTCTLMRILNVGRGWISIVVAMCYLLTWLESVLGFCVGCWMYRLIFGFDDACDACNETTNAGQLNEISEKWVDRTEDSSMKAFSKDSSDDSSEQSV